MTTTDHGSRQQYTGPQVPGRRTAASRQRSRCTETGHGSTGAPGHRGTGAPGHRGRETSDFEVKPDEEHSARHHSPNDYMLAAIHPHPIGPSTARHHSPTTARPPSFAHHSLFPERRPTPPRPPHAHCTGRPNTARYLAPDRVPGHRTPDTVRPTHRPPRTRRAAEHGRRPRMAARQMAGRRASGIGHRASGIGHRASGIGHRQPDTDDRALTVKGRFPGRECPAESVGLSVRP
jgi:hypothetical protein